MSVSDQEEIQLLANTPYQLIKDGQTSLNSSMMTLKSIFLNLDLDSSGNRFSK